MAYESNDPSYPPFTIKFAHSPDLENWRKMPDAIFGTDRYAACPAIRFVDGYYYVLYLEHRRPRWVFETYITRSKDLRHWALSASNPVLRATGLEEGINASDPDLIEFQGKTYLYYSVGDQRTWMNIKRAVYPGTMETFLKSWYMLPGIEDHGTAIYASERKK
jgi:alpha-L-fucosidase